MENIEFGFENLDLWKKVRQFKIGIREETKNFPVDKSID